MPLLLFLAFLAIPLVELWVILQVGSVIGAWWTLLILVADSIAGAYIVRREGRRAWQAFRQALAEGRWPGDEVVQGALVLVGGALLLTPGFVTDVAGLLCVLPPTRAMIAAAVRARFTPMPIPMADPRTARRREPPRGGGAPSAPETLDVEVVSIEPDEPDEDGDA
jgi:UPF0716 protein FxsA